MGVQPASNIAWRSNCIAAIAPNAKTHTPKMPRTGELEEGRRGWKKCGCLIHVSGTLGGKFNRRQTDKADWDEAKALVALWERPLHGTARPRLSSRFRRLPRLHPDASALTAR